MLASSFLDTAIGISFVFLLLSLIASVINEIVLSFFNMRGRYLLKGLKTLLNDESAASLVKDIYSHGQIFGLFRGDFDPKKPGNLPSYIPPSQFAAALLDTLRELGAQISSPKPEAVDGQGVIPTMQLILKAAEDLAAKNAKVGKPLLAMIDAAGNDLSKLTKSVENWYNGAMDRVSGWYKYRTQWVLFGVGLVLAGALNADTVRIVKQLSNDSTLRQSIVAAAQSAKPPGGSAGQPIKDQLHDAYSEMSQFENIGIPLGWTADALPCGSRSLENCRAPGQETTTFDTWLVLGYLSLLRGWLLTAIAVSLGAPFWFDMLNKIMVVRSTVKPGEKSQEQGAKDKK
jgi:hypothetical protein